MKAQDVDLNAEALADILFTANTPTYLFDRFRTDSSVQFLGERISADALLAEANVVPPAGAHDDLYSRLRQYAYLVALSFRPSSEVRAALATRPLPSVRWAEALANLSQDCVPTSTIVVAAPKSARRATDPAQLAADSFGSVLILPRVVDDIPATAASEVSKEITL